MKTYPRLINAIKKCGYDERTAIAAIKGHIIARGKGKESLFSTSLIRMAISGHRHRQAAIKPGFDFWEYRYTQALKACRAKSKVCRND